MFGFIHSWFGVRARVVNKTGKLRCRPTFDVLEVRQALAVDCANISGFVYEDLNANGLLDTNEPVLANSNIELRNAQGQVVGSTRTDAKGYYEFETDSTLGTAQTTKTVPITFSNLATNWAQNQALPKFDPALGTLTKVEIVGSAKMDNQLWVESMDNKVSKITQSMTGTVGFVGPGFSSLPVNLSRSVDFDAAAFDGTIDFAGASGKDFGKKLLEGSNSTTLTDASILALYTGTGTVNVDASATASANAVGTGNVIIRSNTLAAAELKVIYHYIPNNCLKPGNYTIVQVNQPAGYLDGKESRDGTVLANSVGADSIAVTLGTVDLVNNNFGEVKQASIAGNVYVDFNNNGNKETTEPGISGVKVTLTGTNDTGATVNTSTQTDNTGAYLFSALRPGQYSLQETHPTAYTDGKDTVGSQGGSTANDLFSALVLRSGDNGVQNNFGELLPSSSIAGKVHVDLDNDGHCDANEPGIANVTVRLTGTDHLGNAVSKTTTTKADGTYIFEDLQAGTYALTEVQPTAYLDGKDHVGTTGGTLNNDNITNITLDPDENATEYCFGECLPASVSGFVYVDANNNGVFEAGETPLANVAMRLVGVNDQGEQVSLDTTTNSAGFYQFTNLKSGQYRIIETQPTSHADGKESLGSISGIYSANDEMTLGLPVGAHGVNYNFGEITPPIKAVVVPPAPPVAVTSKRFFTASSWLDYWRAIRGL